MKKARSGYPTRLHPAPEEQGDTIQPLPVKRSTTATARQCRESTGLSTRRTAVLWSVECTAIWRTLDVGSEEGG